MQQVAHILYSTRKAPYKEGAGFQGSCTLWSECATQLSGVKKLVESAHFWTLIIVPSFCTLRQIQTGDNFQRFRSSPENEGILLANPLRPYYSAPQSLNSDELSLPARMAEPHCGERSWTFLSSPTVSEGFLDSRVEGLIGRGLATQEPALLTNGDSTTFVP